MVGKPSGAGQGPGSRAALVNIVAMALMLALVIAATTLPWAATSCFLACFFAFFSTFSLTVFTRIGAGSLECRG